MQIVSRNTMGLKRHLSGAEKQALVSFWTSSATPGEMAAVENILDEIRPTSLEGDWIACDCNHDGKAPILHSVLRDDSRFLKRGHGTENQHHKDCPFHKDTEAWQAERALAGQGGVRRANYLSPLEIKRATSLKVAHEPQLSLFPATRSAERSGQHHEAGTLAGTLWTLMQDAGFLIQRQSLQNHKLSELVQVARSIQLHEGRTLAEVMSCNPEDLNDGTLTRRLHAVKNGWPKRMVPALLLIAKVTAINRDGEVEMEAWKRTSEGWRSEKHWFDTALGTTFAQNKANVFSGPGIGAFIVTLDSNKEASILKGYAQPILDAVKTSTGDWAHLLMPVDSELERQALRKILAATSAAHGDWEVMKPVFDIETADGKWCRPDFMVYAGAGKSALIIETMGDASPEYLTRKAVQHEIMKSLGELFLDHREAGTNDAANLALWKEVAQFVGKNRKKAA